ncbi:hypothetical protein HC891_26740 [Candidatus Gracilibacteria bacterium]|nr:hypothetical protein [Candidatus Gracilibacteria bacterium]
MLPPADFIYAGLSLPFCQPACFAATWAQIRSALRPGARFAGHLFGARDSWVGDSTMSFFTLTAACQLLDGLEIEYFHEIDEYGASFVGPKHWHIFELIARQPLGKLTKPRLTPCARSIGPVLLMSYATTSWPPRILTPRR